MKDEEKMDEYSLAIGFLMLFVCAFVVGFAWLSFVSWALYGS